MDWKKKLAKNLTPISEVPKKKGRGDASSVMVLICRSKKNEETILLTKRTTLVETHKGHVSFPGGFYESPDKTLLNTALRECEEEIGTAASDIETLGALTTVHTRTQVPIYPWVGILKTPYPFNLNPNEVEKLLFLPLNDLLEKGMRAQKIQIGKLRVLSLGVELDGETVWGATGRILKQLREKMVS